MAVLEGETEDWKFAASVFTLVDFFVDVCKEKNQKEERKENAGKGLCPIFKMLVLPTKKCI